MSGLHFPACTARAASRSSSSPNGRAAEQAAGSRSLGWKVKHSRTEPTQTPGLSMICGRKGSEHPRTRTSDPVRPPVRPSVCYWQTHTHTHTHTHASVSVVLCCVGSVHPAVIRACLDGYVTHTHTHSYTHTLRVLVLVRDHDGEPAESRSTSQRSDPSLQSLQQTQPPPEEEPEGDHRVLQGDPAEPQQHLQHIWTRTGLRSEQ